MPNDGHDGNWWSLIHWRCIWWDSSFWLIESDWIIAERNAFNDSFMALINQSVLWLDYFNDDKIGRHKFRQWLDCEFRMHDWKDSYEMRMWKWWWLSQSSYNFHELNSVFVGNLKKLGGAVIKRPTSSHGFLTFPTCGSAVEVEEEVQLLPFIFVNGLLKNHKRPAAFLSIESLWMTATGIIRLMAGCYPPNQLSRLIPLGIIWNLRQSFEMNSQWRWIF